MELFFPRLMAFSFIELFQRINPVHLYRKVLHTHRDKPDGKRKNCDLSLCVIRFLRKEIF